VRPGLQDCPDGEKCVPYGPTLGEDKCVPVMGSNPPGEQCQYDGPVRATDDCDESGVCWDHDFDGDGMCLAFCTGDADAPTCEIRGTTCLVKNNGAVFVCSYGCDPLAQDCSGDGAGCYWVYPGFFSCKFTNGVGGGTGVCSYGTRVWEGLLHTVLRDWDRHLPRCDVVPPLVRRAQCAARRGRHRRLHHRLGSVPG
jgi:hypothetical protein